MFEVLCITLLGIRYDHLDNKVLITEVMFVEPESSKQEYCLVQSNNFDSYIMPHLHVRKFMNTFFFL